MQVNLLAASNDKLLSNSYIEKVVTFHCFHYSSITYIKEVVGQKKGTKEMVAVLVLVLHCVGCHYWLGRNKTKSGCVHVELLC